MAKIPEETVQQIYDAVHIEDVIGDFVTLKRRGSNLLACCPFHNEKTPSFSVSPSKNIYKCFGCGKAGGAVDFLMEYDHLTFPEALRYLADKYHIEIQEKEETAEEVAARQKSESLYIVSEFAFKFFQEAMETPEGSSIAKAYYRMRGLEDETVRKYGLGWAPKSRHALTDAAIKAGYKPEYLVETGLCAQSEDGKIYDRFYDRVIFPISSVTGRVIAFGGRTLYKDYKERNLGKYVNSKESEIYVKSNSLYGISFAKNEIAKKDKCYLVEGYLDVLSMHQLGITNVVASSGTSLTEGQIRIIKRFTNNVTIMYDGDSAGIHAALRGIGMVLKAGMDVKVVLIPDGDDPDSYSRKHTLAEVEEFIAKNEQDFIRFKMDLLLNDAGDDPLKRASLINDIADTIALIPDPVKRSVYSSACSTRLNIDASLVGDRIRRTREIEREEEKKAREREARRERVQGAGPGSLDVPGPQGVRLPERPQTIRYAKDADPFASVETNRIVGPVERELLYFLLTHGTDEMQFESDSDYYTGNDNAVMVAEFIDQAVQEAGMANEAYAKVYEAYMTAFYDEGLAQDEIVRKLTMNEDEQVRFVTAQLCIEKYQLTVKSFSEAMTTTSSWLVNSVPRAILAFHEKRLEYRMKELKDRLATAPEDEDAILQEYSKVLSSWKTVRSRLGKERQD